MLTAKCSHCDAVVHSKKGVEVVECSNCGEQVPRIDFVDDGVYQQNEMNFELENAKSLRSIAMSLQILATAQTPPEVRDALLSYCVGSLDG